MAILSALPIASLLLFPAPQSSHDYIPGAVLKAGWPEGATGNVEELVAVRFVDPLELDFAARIDDEVFLVYRPTQVETYLSMGTGVSAIAALPLDGNLDGVLAATATGLVLKTWDGAQSTWKNTTVPNAEGWNNVDRLWIREEAWGSRVYGHDPQAAKLLAMDWDGDDWSGAPSANLPGDLRDMLFFDFDPDRPGLERAWLFESALFVTDTEGSANLLVTAASATDVIGKMRGVATGEELLVWVTPWAGGPTTLLAINSLGGAPLYPLGSETFSDLAVVDVDLDGGDDVILTRPGEASALILMRSGTPPHPFVPLYWGDAIDTLEPEFVGPEPGIRTTAIGDFDKDGDDDLLVAHEGTGELRLWINVLGVWEEMLRLWNNKEPILQLNVPSATENTVSIDMNYNPLVPSNSFRIQVWLQPNFTSNQGLVMLDEVIRTLPAGSSIVPYSYTYSTEGLPPTHVLWISYSAVDLQGSTIVDCHPTRHVFISPSLEVEFLLDGRHYPTPEHTEQWEEPPGPGGTPGLRSCGRVGICNT